MRAPPLPASPRRRAWCARAEISRRAKALNSGHGARGETAAESRAQVFAEITSVRETARASMSMLKHACQWAPALHQPELSGLQDEFRTALARFHTAAESASSALGPAPAHVAAGGSGGGGDDETELALGRATCGQVVITMAAGAAGRLDESTAPLMVRRSLVAATRAEPRLLLFAPAARAGVRAGGRPRDAAHVRARRSRALPLAQAADIRSPHELQQEQQQQLEAAISLRSEAIAEREAGIAAVQQSVREVHEIFHDLALLVHEQGAQVRSCSARPPLARLASPLRPAARRHPLTCRPARVPARPRPLRAMSRRSTTFKPT